MELREKTSPQGAYCQDFATFKQLYRFVERGLMRLPISAYTVLLTLVDDRKQFVTLQDREYLMEKLGGTICASLRSGDVYTRYSSCQYLVMVSDVDNQNAELIANRISETFYAETAAIKDKLLLHHCYPLKPVKIYVYLALT